MSKLYLIRYLSVGSYQEMVPGRSLIGSLDLGEPQFFNILYLREAPKTCTGFEVYAECRVKLFVLRVKCGPACNDLQYH